MLPHVRCDSPLEAASGLFRCQLYVGHEFEHAAPVLEAGLRVLRRWLAAMVEDMPFDTRVTRLPWAPGCPSIEAQTPVVDLHIVSTRPGQLRTARTADLHIA